MSEHVGMALLQVFEWLAAPVAGNRVGKRLTETDRTVKVDGDDSETLPGISLWVPAIAPTVAHDALRAAVDNEGDRIFLVWIKVDRLDDVAVYRVVIGTGELEVFDLTQSQVSQRLVVATR